MTANFSTQNTYRIIAVFFDNDTRWEAFVVCVDCKRPLTPIGSIFLNEEDVVHTNNLFEKKIYV